MLEVFISVDFSLRSVWIGLPAHTSVDRSIFYSISQILGVLLGFYSDDLFCLWFFQISFVFFKLANILYMPSFSIRSTY